MCEGFGERALPSYADFGLFVVQGRDRAVLVGRPDNGGIGFGVPNVL
jgi:hypothetical protein